MYDICNIPMLVTEYIGSLINILLDTQLAFQDRTMLASVICTLSYMLYEK